MTKIPAGYINQLRQCKDECSEQKEVVTTLAFLLGVKKDSLEHFSTERLSWLIAQPEAKIIRALCTTRNALMSNYPAVEERIRNPETRPNDLSWLGCFDGDALSAIESNGIEIYFPGTTEAPDVLNRLDSQIRNRVRDACKSLFPNWFNRQYICELFSVKGSYSPSEQRKRVNEFNSCAASYPYKVWINWPVRNPRAYDLYAIEDATIYSAEPQTGNILLNDIKFTVLCYRIHGSVFQDFWRLKPEECKARMKLREYLNPLKKPLRIIVDGENSQPFKLAAAVQFIHDVAPKIDLKILIVDDSNTNGLWRVFPDLVSVPVEVKTIPRVKREKSLVDISVTAAMCRELYVHKNACMLASSDSDYYGLLAGMIDTDEKNVPFFVLTEDGKTATALCEAYDAGGVLHCSLDEFTEEAERFEDSVLQDKILEYFEAHAFPIEDIVSELQTNSGISMNSQRREWLATFLRETPYTVSNADGCVRIRYQPKESTISS